jgi:hypothetical protein
MMQDEIARSITGAIAPGIIAAEIRQAQRKERSPDLRRFYDGVPPSCFFSTLTDAFAFRRIAKIDALVLIRDA